MEPFTETGAPSVANELPGTSVTRTNANAQQNGCITALQYKAFTAEAVKDGAAPGFVVDGNGLHRWEVASKDDNALPTHYRKHYVCPPLHVNAMARDPQGHGWTLLMRYRDHDGKEHQERLPRSCLASRDSSEVIRFLIDRGFPLTPDDKTNKLLLQFLRHSKPKARVRDVPRIGWHDNDHRTFVLPHITVGSISRNETVQVQLGTGHKYACAGKLEQWQQHIGSKVTGQHRMVFAIAAAFAPPLMALLGVPGGGFHLYGASKDAKTTTARLAGSVWGGRPGGDFLQSWRATDNGLEAVALAHNDALFCPDEIGQADSRTLGQTLYMLANGQAKSRMSKQIELRPKQEWNLLVLSTGEVSIETRIRQGKGTIHAGQLVRFPSIPSDAGTGLGVLDMMPPGYHHAADFHRDINGAVGKYYGTPIIAFLQKLLALEPQQRQTTLDDARKAMTHFLYQCLPTTASAQAGDVARRFALVAAAGTMATGFGITGWDLHDNDAFTAAGVCLTATLAETGTGNLDSERGLRELRRVLLERSDAWFVPFRTGMTATKFNETRQRCYERKGYYEQTGSGPCYYIESGSFASLIPDHDAKAVLRLLNERGLLDKEDGRPGWQKSKRLPDGSNRRYYTIKPAFLSDPVEA